MPKQELRDAECYLRSLQPTGLRTLKKGRTRRLQPHTLSSEEQHSAIHPYQIMEQVKAGGHKGDAGTTFHPGSSAFRSQGLGTQKGKSLCCYRVKNRLDSICNHARNALSKVNSSKSVKPLQYFCTGLWGSLGHLHTSYCRKAKF